MLQWQVYGNFDHILGSQLKQGSWEVQVHSAQTCGHPNTCRSLQLHLLQADKAVCSAKILFQCNYFTFFNEKKVVCMNILKVEFKPNSSVQKLHRWGPLCCCIDFQKFCFSAQPLVKQRSYRWKKRDWSDLQWYSQPHNVRTKIKSKHKANTMKERHQPLECYLD